MRFVALVCGVAMALGGLPVPAQEVAAALPIQDLALASTPSFNESFNCDGPDGIRGPVVPSVGRQGAAVEVFGPWGDAFGRSIGAIEESLVWWEMPFSGGYHVRVHRLALPAFEQAARNLRNAVRDVPWRDYEVRGRYTFGWHPATVPPHPYLSFHAFGTAVDINSNTNPFRTDNLLITDMPSWFVRAWTDAGFCWGGNWRDLKDPMHFSWKGPLAIPGYGSPPLPTAPRTQRTAFRQVARQSTTALDPAAGAATFVEDIDRDGAPDVVVLRPWTSSGRHRMESARARTGFETCLGAVTAPIPMMSRSSWAITTGPADLYVVRRGGAGVATRLEVWTVGLASQALSWMSPFPSTTPRPRRRGGILGSETTMSMV